MYSYVAEFSPTDVVLRRPGLKNTGGKDLEWYIESKESIDWLMIAGADRKYKPVTKSSSLISGTLASGKMERIYLKLTDFFRTDYGPKTQIKYLYVYNKVSGFRVKLQVVLRMPRLDFTTENIQLRDDGVVKRLYADNIGDPKARYRLWISGPASIENSSGNKYVKIVGPLREVGGDKDRYFYKFSLRKGVTPPSKKLEESYLVYSNADSKDIRVCSLPPNTMLKDPRDKNGESAADKDVSYRNSVRTTACKRVVVKGSYGSYRGYSAYTTHVYFYVRPILS